MKKLKKLKLKKQTVINLNNLEMNSLKGGASITTSSEPCYIATTVIIGYTRDLYDQWRSNAPYDCHNQSDYQHVSDWTGAGYQQSDVFETGYCATSIVEVVCY